MLDAKTLLNQGLYRNSLHGILISPLCLPIIIFYFLYSLRTFSFVQKRHSGFQSPVFFFTMIFVLHEHIFFKVETATVIILLGCL